MAIQFNSGPKTSTGTLYLSKVSDISSCTLTVNDIGSGNTITVEQSDDNVTYTEIEAVTAEGKYTYDVTDYVYFRVTLSTYDAGLVWVEVEEGQAPLPAVPPGPQIGVPLTQMTETERDAIESPVNGLLIFNMDTGYVEVYAEGWYPLAYYTP